MRDNKIEAYKMAIIAVIESKTMNDNCKIITLKRLCKELELAEIEADFVKKQEGEKNDLHI